MNQLCVCRRRERDHVFRAPDVGPKGFLSSGVMAHIRRRMNHLLHTAVQALIRIRRQAQSILGNVSPESLYPVFAALNPAGSKITGKSFPQALLRTAPHQAQQAALPGVQELFYQMGS